MIIVNVSDLRSDVNRMNNLIDEMEEIKLNLFNQLEDSCVNWYDGNSFVFNEKIHLDSKEMDEVISTLKEKREVYDYICFKYGELGNKIKCNLDNEDKLYREIEETIKKTDDVLTVLETITVDVSASINEINEVKEILETFQELIKEVLEKIKEFEREINAKINSLSLVKINELDFDIDLKE